MSGQCEAIIQTGPRKGTRCENISDSQYCSKHIRHTLIDKAKEKNIRYCDIARGCFTILEDTQSKCTQCLHKSRINERKRNAKKRDDPNLCLDCGILMTYVTRAKGKHDKLLRRCIKCYEKLLKCEESRPVRERNYKEESFKNKNVAWNHYVKGATQRKLDFKLTKTQFNELIIQECFYCNYHKSGEVNGIDRIDNDKGYIIENVVTCCQTCNSLKGASHPQEFIDKIIAIYNYKEKSEVIDYAIVDKWKSTYLSRSTPTYKSYSKNATKRNIEFRLNEEEFKNIVAQPCYLCGIATSDKNKNGIDRVNNNLGYIISNCCSCCGHCNLMKRDIPYDIIIDRVQKISLKYDILTLYFSTFDIKTRTSKISARETNETPIIADKVEREYKPLNEIIVPTSDEPLKVKELLNTLTIEPELEITPHKQWKSQQIYDAIIANNENTYKEYCEANNDLSKIPTWESDWIEFVLSVKGRTFEESEKYIKDFVENLRRIRHNTLCYKKNSKLLDSDSRQQWPATTVVRAFLEGKIDKFKEFTENATGDKPDDSKWQKRWSAFVESLESNKDNLTQLKALCSKFMTSQRTKKYRRS
jgi:hypothetical protein